MTDTHSKKAIMKMLGIHQLISEYENRCQKTTARKKNINPSQIRNRYTSLLDIDNKKSQMHINVNIPSKSTADHQQIHTKSTVNNSLTENNISEINSIKSKVRSSLENFVKNTLHTQKGQRTKKNYTKTNESSHQFINTYSEAVIKSKPKEQVTYSSYLNLKAKNTQKQTKSNQKVQIDFDNPTLAGINKKIKEFETKGITRDERSTVFKKNTKNKQNQQENMKNHKIDTMGLSQTISFENETAQEKKSFISIDTNYYGFSFKNKIPFKPCKSELKKESCMQISSTLDKSTNQQVLSNQKEAKCIKTVSKSTAKMQPSTGRKTYNTLNTDLKDRYNSTNLLNKKKNHSSLVLKPKSILKDRYQIMKVIGRGMSGQVFQAKDVLSDRFVAIKEIDQNCIEYDFFREISHQNIIRYYNNFVENGKRYLVLEYFPMTLRDLLKDSKKQIDLTENDVKHIFKSILNGLSYLHSLNIAHRDIKLDNIVISSDLTEVKFIDFGLCIDLSKTQQGGLSKEFCGTLSYLPPEIVEGQPHEPKKADIWSLGIVLYAISVGRLPFKGRNESDLLSKICKSKPVYPQCFNQKLKELIECMLQKNPTKRWTVNRILSHEWLH